MTAPVSFTLLVRDDRHVLETIRQLRPHVAEIVVGYTDNDVLGPGELYVAGADNVVNVPAPLRDWAAARNAVMAECRQPFVSWADSDDEFRGIDRLPEALDLLVRHPLARLLAPYHYLLDDAGNPTHVQKRERIWRNDGRFTWVHPCHETLIAKDGQYGPEEPRADFLVWRHHRQPQPESLSQQFEILREYERTRPDDGWLLQTLGATLFRLIRRAEAVPYLERAVAVCGDDDDKAMTQIMLARSEVDLGHFARAEEWARKAIALRPGVFETHYALGQILALRAVLRQEREQIGPAMASLKAARECPHVDHRLGVSLQDVRAGVHMTESILHEALGDIPAATASFAQFADNTPPDPEIRVVRRQYEARSAALTFQAPSGGLDVVFACGPCWEAWNPAVLDERGLGGSETAVIEMARRLRKAGSRVRVFANVGGDGIYEGVEYRDWEGSKPPTCDVLVAWRNGQLLEWGEAKVRLAWAHDVVLANMTPARALLADRVLGLSEWHCRNLVAAHGLDRERVVRTANGIDLGRFGGGASARDPHRIIWSSSLDRGAQVLVDLFPEIRRRVPDATLDVYYGADQWLAIADKSGSEQQRYAVRSLIRRMQTTEGITYHGRVDQKRLAREMLASGVWVGTQWFPETSCIGAHEAQAAGLRCISADVSCMGETLGERGVLLSGDWLSDGYRAVLVDAVVDALTRPEGQWAATREELMAYARERFSWDSVASSWMSMFAGLLEEYERGAMPAYRGRAA